MGHSERKTEQLLIPGTKKETEAGNYDIYPGYSTEPGALKNSYSELAEFILKQKKVIFDGYAGVFWDKLKSQIDKELRLKNKKAIWYDFSVATKNPDQIDAIIEPYLGGNDPVFGKKANLELNDFFDVGIIKDLNPEESTDIHIIYGTGAALSHWKDSALIYVDLPKNELQFRMRAGRVKNLGAQSIDAPKKMYKRFYFVDWVVLNKHKQKLLPQLDIIIDAQRADEITWTNGETLRKCLHSMSTNFFRVRPWFEPGPWGGTWIKDNIEQLNKDVPNYAWSFELIVPENGLLLEDERKMLEVSFDMLMYQENRSVLGEAAKRFGYEFPIRFDFLDTFDGGNLSIQCHPLTEYIKKEFGESFTQDETYYILDRKDDSIVYLGFRESIDPDGFKKELKESFSNNTKVDIKKYVMSYPSQKHDFFLIPAGTIHGSGINNLVLEISATPYIFTFKLYDWLRPDLDGKPRPLNIDRGFDNLQFDRKGDYVTNNLISKPYLLESGDDWELYHLPTHAEHFYDVHRYEFITEVHAETNGECHVLMLVEGESITLQTTNGKQQRFNYAETFVVPAAAKSYMLVNNSPKKAKVIKAFVKPDQNEEI